MKQNTTDKIAALLSKGRSITPLQALEKFGCLRLAARINDLRSNGWKIQTLAHKTPTGKFCAKYKLVKP